jgi:hypothetical protein
MKIVFIMLFVACAASTAVEKVDLLEEDLFESFNGDQGENLADLGWNPDLDDHIYTTPNPTHDEQDVEELQLFTQNLQENAQEADSSASCNGVVGLCNKRYDEVVWAAAHNAGAHSLTFDIAKYSKCAEQEQKCTGGFEQTCTNWKNTCTRHQTECTGGFKQVCDSWSKKCSSWGGWSWVCRGFTWVCNRTKNVCKAYGSVCKATARVCTATKSVCKGWGQVCKKSVEVAEYLVPDWLESCVWENQDFSFAGLLNNGVRYLDVDTCVKNNVVYNCHGKGATPRALGMTLKDSLHQINSFLAANPNEIVTLSFGDYDNEASVVGPLIKADLLAVFGSKLYAGSYNSWPTLAAMKSTPVVILMTKSLREQGPQYNWAKWGGPWNSWSKAINGAKTTGEIEANTLKFCTDYGADNHMKSVNFFGTIRLPTKDEMKNIAQFKKTKYALCNKDWTRKLSKNIDSVMTHCDNKIRKDRLHSVMTDYDDISGVVEVVTKMNKARV